MAYEVTPASRITALRADSTLAKKLTVAPLDIADIIQIKRLAGGVEPFKNGLFGIHQISPRDERAASTGVAQQRPSVSARRVTHAMSRMYSLFGILFPTSVEY